MNESTTILASRLGQMLVVKKATVSCAESCTGGGIAYALTSVAGSSAWFEQSFVTYSNNAKMSLLGVSNDVLEQHGAVSKQTVEQMAQGCAKRANADFAIAVSGIAGPDGGSADKPVGLVWFGFQLGNDTYTRQQVFTGDRQAVRQQAIDYALLTLLNFLESVSN